MGRGIDWLTSSGRSSQSMRLAACARLVIMTVRSSEGVISSPRYV